MRDAARDSLLGYTYQFMGIASLRALSSETTGEGLSAVFRAKVAAGRLIHEWVGQDAAVRQVPGAPGGSILIQFKHSGDEGNDLDESELIEILCKLDRSRQEAARLGETVDEHVVITNRRLAADALSLYNARSGLARPAKLELRQFNKKNGDPIKKNQALLSGYADAAAAANAWFEVLKRVTIFPGISFAAALDHLRRFASRHGVTAEEFPTRANTAIGTMLSQTVSGLLEIDLPWLREHLVGARDCAVARIWEGLDPRRCPSSAQRAAWASQRANDKPTGPTGTHEPPSGPGAAIPCGVLARGRGFWKKCPRSSASH